MKTTQSVEKDSAEVPEESSAIKEIAACVGVTGQKASEMLEAIKSSIASRAKAAKDKGVELVSDKSAPVIAAFMACGAAVVGTGGAAIGMLLGGVVGAAMGVVPAIFTFGLSIPIAAALGACGGLVLGGAIGTAMGVVAGGVGGCGAYTNRAKIASLIRKVEAKGQQGLGKGKAVASEAKAKAAESLGVTKSMAIETSALAKRRVVEHLNEAREKASAVLESAQQQAGLAAQATKMKVVEMVTDKTMQVTAMSAAGVATSLGAAGAAAGFATGGAIGALVGVVLAPFTLGLSIPVFTTILSGCGLAIGAVVGGATGLVGGGAIGHGVYTNREVIGKGLSKTLAKALSPGSYMRHRSAGATGGTADLTMSDSSSGA